MYELVIVLPAVRDDFIGRCLDTLYKYTDPSLFRVIVMDQTPEGIYEKVKDQAHFYIRPNRNLGFAKAANEGIIHGYRWGAKYIAVLNDDTEFMHKNWWQGIKDEFATHDNILCVNPESPRVPLWGYGRHAGENLDILPYKEEYTDEDWNYLVAGEYQDLVNRYPVEPEGLGKDDQGKNDWGGKIYIPPAFPLHKEGVIDGIAMWFPVFKREFFEKVGLLSEHYYPGGGEDYDTCTKAYSCAWPDERDECDPQYHYRMVSSMKSWVWHHWGQSKDKAAELSPKLKMFDPELRWNNIDYHWPPELNKGHHSDPWGHYDDNGVRRPFKRIKDPSDVLPL